jgi:hypothetical protein
MCLLRPKKRGQTIQDYGVLMHNIEEESICGICLMEDGRYVTLNWDSLHLAFKRVKEDEFALTEAKGKEIRNMYLTALEDYTASELRIAHAQAAFQKATHEADLAHRAKLAAKVKYNTKTTAIPKVLMKDLDDFEKPHAKCAAKHAGSDDEGEWRTGTVEKMKQNKYRKWAYYTVFDTPSRFAEWFDAGTTKDARINYLKLEAIREAQVTSDDDGLSSRTWTRKGQKGGTKRRCHHQPKRARMEWSVHRSQP